MRAALQGVNVFTGLNGCGKTNLYRALQLVARAADGRLSRTLAQEGGLGSALWAGEGQKRGKPVRLRIAVQLDDWGYELSCGLPTPDNSKEPTYFSLDPLVREEYVWSGARRTAANTHCERRESALIVRDASGRPAPHVALLDPGESMLAQLSDPQTFPELFARRAEITQWRFYHHFDTGPRSPLREPALATCTPVLAEDGRDLICALRTIHEIGDSALLYATLRDAFPAASWEFRRADSGFMTLRMLSSLPRPLDLRELSDGTLRFLCLAAALLSPRPPKLLALNEPENSLHAGLLPALGRLVARAAAHSQIWVTTHSRVLADEIASAARVRPFELLLSPELDTQGAGATRFDHIEAAE